MMRSLAVMLRVAASILLANLRTKPILWVPEQRDGEKTLRSP